MKQKFTKIFANKLLLAFSFILFAGLVSAQTTYTWKGGAGSSGSPGDYSVASNWSPTRTTPATNDIIRFDLGNVNGSNTAGNIFVTNVTTQTVGQLQIYQSGTLATRTLTFAGTPGTLTVTNNLTFQQSCVLADGGYTISVGGDIAFQTNTGANITTSQTFHSGAGKIQITGSSSRFYNGTGTTQTTGNFQFGNIEIKGSAASLSMTATYNAIQINGTLTIDQGKFNMSNATANRTFILNSSSSVTPTGLINCLNGGVVVGGSNAGFSITGSGPSSGNSSIGTINFDATSATTSTLNNISFTRSNSTLTIGSVNAAGLTISGSIALNAGTLDDGGNVINVGGGNLFTTTNTTPGNAIYKSTGSGLIKYTRANATSPVFFNSQTTASKCYLEVGNITWAPSASSAGQPQFNSGTATNQISVTLNGNFNFTRNGTNSQTLTIDSKVDTFYVAPTASITIPTGLTFDFNNKPVVFKSSATNTAAISSVTGTLSNATNVTLQQWITGQRGYRILSNPFSTALTPSTVGTANGITITGSNDVKTYNTSTNTWTNNISSIAANKPYSVFIRGLASEVTGGTYTAGPTAFAYNVTGTLNTSSVTITQDNSSNSAFTIVGNPFAGPVNSSALTNATAGTPYYIYSMSQNNSGGTRVKSGGWVAASSNSSTTTPIPMMGVVAYQAGTGASSTFSVPLSAINTTNAAQTGLFGEGDATTQLELQLNKDGLYQDKLFVRFDANSTEKGNERMDLAKLNNDVTNIYTITSDKARLAVDARKGIDDIIPIGVTSTVGKYSFTVASNNFVNASNVYLLDKLTNTKTALEPGATYSFEITSDAATQGDNRFELGTIKTQVQDVVTNDKFSVKVLGNVVNNAVTVQVKGAKSSSVQITVVDMQGKLLSNTTTSREVNNINVVGGSGMYLIKVTDGDNSIVSKVVKP